MKEAITIVIIGAGIVLLAAVGSYIERKLRKPPIRQLVFEFLYFDFDFKFEGTEMVRKVRLVENKSKWQIKCITAGHGNWRICYLGEDATGDVFSEEELIKLTKGELC